MSDLWTLAELDFKKKYVVTGKLWAYNSFMTMVSEDPWGQMTHKNLQAKWQEVRASEAGSINSDPKQMCLGPWHGSQEILQHTNQGAAVSLLGGADETQPTLSMWCPARYLQGSQSLAPAYTVMAPLAKKLICLDFPDKQNLSPRALKAKPALLMQSHNFARKLSRTIFDIFLIGLDWYCYPFKTMSLLLGEF